MRFTKLVTVLFKPPEWKIISTKISNRLFISALLWTKNLFLRGTREKKILYEQYSSLYPIFKDAHENKRKGKLNKKKEILSVAIAHGGRQCICGWNLAAEFFAPVVTTSLSRLDNELTDSFAVSIFYEGTHRLLCRLFFVQADNCRPHRGYLFRKSSWDAREA